MTSKDIAAVLRAWDGTATLTALQREPLNATMSMTMTMGKLVLTDAKGGMATTTPEDVLQSNGVIHVVDTMLMP